MAKLKTVFLCDNCGHQSPKWLGRCPECREWGTLIEKATEESPPLGGQVRAAAAVSLAEVDRQAESRRLTGLSELDRVLGGGVLPGMVVLVGGDPGIGKSTLMLQVLGHLAGQDGPVLYLSGEESARQVRLRADRLGLSGESLFLVTETRTEPALKLAAELNPGTIVVDSIQTLTAEGVSSAPGSLVQIREAAARFIRHAKETDRAVFLVGHVTKAGALAGPRVIEHMVDTVLYFEGQASHGFRVLRAVKNRFGSTNEIGVFEMGDKGLAPVANPSALFLAERPAGQPGSVVTPSLEGSRPILVEIQALVAASSYAAPRRTALGVDPGRVALLAAVLERQVGLSLAGQDIFVNGAGGMKVGEPAVDLAVALALAGSLLDRPLDEETVVLGEIGLAGEVRAVGRAEIRLAEAAKLGFKRAVVPRRVAEQVGRPPLKLIGVATLAEAVKRVLG